LDEPAVEHLGLPSKPLPKHSARKPGEHHERPQATPGIREHHNRFQVRYWGADGRQHSQSFRLKSEAVRFQRKIRSLWTSRSGPIPRPHRRRSAFEPSSTSPRRLRIRPRTREKYESTLRNYLSRLRNDARTSHHAGRRPRVGRRVGSLWPSAGNRPGPLRPTRGHPQTRCRRRSHRLSPCRNVELPRSSEPSSATSTSAKWRDSRWRTRLGTAP
jgi:hypothetical protein